MFGRKLSYFRRLIKTYPTLKVVDIFDRKSFIREYVLDNIYVCVFMYFLFNAALWYANKVIERIEKANEELRATVHRNRMNLDDVMALNDKKAEYEDVVVKAKGAQKITANHLENEMKTLSTELLTTADKMAELEMIHGKCKFWEKTQDRVEGIFEPREGDGPEGPKSITDSIENVKILEPSFPPTLPPVPPPRKYGIFVSRPPGSRPTTTPGTPPPKIGFK